MALGTSTSRASSMTLEERINGVVKDSPMLLYDLTKVGVSPDTNEPIEIVVDLPAAPDPDILLGHISRWREVQVHFKKDIRVYAWCVNPIVEKRVLACVQNMSGIYITVLPDYLKEKKVYGF